MTSQGLRVALSLVTARPGKQGGAESSYVRNLLGRFVAGEGPVHVTLLANAAVEEAYAERVGGPVVMRLVPGFDFSGGKATRAVAMARATAFPRALAAKLPPDFDLIHYPIAVPVPRVEAPSVITLHDVAHLAMPKLFSPATRLYRRVAYDAAARRADLVITVSDHARTSLIEHLGLDPDRVVRVTQGIDRALFAPNGEGDDDLLAPLGLPERFIVYPANLWAHKNHQRLLEALALVDDPDLGLVLTGQDYGRLPELVSLARSLGIQERVRHLGHVPVEIIPALYRRAVALVFASLYEGFGAPPLEAMACGCAVACSTGGSLPEVSGAAALTFDPHRPEEMAAVIERITRDEALRGRLRAAGARHVEGFSWSRTARQHMDAYARALQVRT